MNAERVRTGREPSTVRVVPTDQIVNVAGIAAMACVCSSAVSIWIKRHPSFPKPLDVPLLDIRSKLWDARDIRDWLVENDRLPKRRSSSS